VKRSKISAARSTVATRCEVFSDAIDFLPLENGTAFC
jgi:hypothetical protein